MPVEVASEAGRFNVSKPLAVDSRLVCGHAILFQDDRLPGTILGLLVVKNPLVTKCSNVIRLTPVLRVQLVKQFEQLAYISKLSQLPTHVCSTKV